MNAGRKRRGRFFIMTRSLTKLYFCGKNKAMHMNTVVDLAKCIILASDTIGYLQCIIQQILFNKAWEHGQRGQNNDWAFFLTFLNDDLIMFKRRETYENTMDTVVADFQGWIQLNTEWNVCENVWQELDSCHFLTTLLIVDFMHLIKCFLMHNLICSKHPLIRYKANI